MQTAIWKSDFVLFGLRGHPCKHNHISLSGKSFLLALLVTDGNKVQGQLKAAISNHLGEEEKKRQQQLLTALQMLLEEEEEKRLTDFEDWGVKRKYYLHGEGSNINAKMAICCGQ